MASNLQLGESHNSLAVWSTGLNNYVDTVVYRNADLEDASYERHSVPVLAGNLIVNNLKKLPDETVFVRPQFRISKNGSWRSVIVDFSDVLDQPLSAIDIYRNRLLSTKVHTEDIEATYGFGIEFDRYKVSGFTVDGTLEPQQALSKLAVVKLAETALARSFKLRE